MKEYLRVSVDIDIELEDQDPVFNDRYVVDEVLCYLENTFSTDFVTLKKYRRTFRVG